MKKATIEDVPEWFWTAEMYQKELSLAEWALELDARLYLFQLSLDEGFDLEGIEKPNMEWNKKFVDFTINRNRDEWHSEQNQRPPITLLKCDPVNHKQSVMPSYVVTTDAGSFPLPLVLNMNYSDRELIEAFKNFLAQIRGNTDFSRENRYAVQFFTKRLCGNVKDRVTHKLTQRQQGTTPYSEAFAKRWSENCVLEFIDLFLWGELNDIEYPPEILASIFWHQDTRRPQKYNASKDRLALKRQTHIEACELLNPYSIARIKATITGIPEVYSVA